MKTKEDVTFENIKGKRSARHLFDENCGRSWSIVTVIKVKYSRAWHQILLLKHYHITLEVRTLQTIQISIKSITNPLHNG